MLSPQSVRAVRARFLLMLGVAVYISAFLYSYQQWIAPRYEYWGMGYRDVPIGYILSSWVMCLTSALWIPRNLSRPSQLLFFVQYFIIFIPASFVLYYSVRPEFPPEEALIIIVALFSGLTILQAGYKVPLLAVRPCAVSNKVFWSVFWCGSAGLFVYLLTVFGSYFQLADFKNMYDVRNAAEAITAASGSSFAGYARAWLASFVLPFLFSVGIFHRRRSFIALTAVGYLYLFGIGSSKSTMLAMAYLPAIYLLVRSGGRNAGTKIAVCFAGLLMFPAILGLAGQAGETINTWYIAIIHARTFSIPQISIGQYYDFFQSHPLTHGSHISGVNLFVNYPYDRDIPRTIGNYFYGNPELTENVNMWAQDGITSFGLAGVPIVSAIATIIFWFFDSIAALHDPRFSTVALGSIALIFGNGSLFTTMITGGLLMLLIALYFYPNTETTKLTSATSIAK